MLINKACAAVLKAVGKGTGDSPYNHVRVDKEKIEATNKSLIVRITLPKYSDKHPEHKRRCKAGEKLIHKRYLSALAKMLTGKDEDDPRGAALVTDAGLLKTNGTEIASIDIKQTQETFPWKDFPDIGEQIPDDIGPRSHAHVSTLIRALQAAKEAGVVDVRIGESDGNGALIVDGRNERGQEFLAVLLGAEENDE